ncbi:MAG: PIN domain-containing protein [Deltaproteobacteria bacterium]|nr:PIN domain-containing protein [Deltaproteobacteria bacterium]
MIYLLDTSALLVLYRKEPEVDRVLALFDDPQHDILLSTVSVAEFGRKLRELGKDREEIEETLDQFMQLFSHVVPIDEAVARASLWLVESVPLRLPMADSLIAASALVYGACLVHKDKHMAAIPPEVLTTLNLVQP